MSKRQGIRTTSQEWAKHLRKEGKRTFWKKHRKTEKQECYVSRCHYCGCAVCAGDVFCDAFCASNYGALGYDD